MKQLITGTLLALALSPWAGAWAAGPDTEAGAVSLRDSEFNITLMAPANGDAAGPITGRFTYQSKTIKYRFCEATLQQSGPAHAGVIDLKWRVVGPARGCFASCMLTLTDGLQNFRTACSMGVGGPGHFDSVVNADALRPTILAQEARTNEALAAQRATETRARAAAGGVDVAPPPGDPRRNLVITDYPPNPKDPWQATRVEEWTDARGEKQRTVYFPPAEASRRVAAQERSVSGGEGCVTLREIRVTPRESKPRECTPELGYGGLPTGKCAWSSGMGQGGPDDGKRIVARNSCKGTAQWTVACPDAQGPSSLWKTAPSDEYEITGVKLSCKVIVRALSN